MPKSAAFGSEHRAVLAVAESLLTRGATPFCSPALEDYLLAGLPESDPKELLGALQELTAVPTSVFTPSRLDSAEESEFYRIVNTWLEPDSGWCTLPQVRSASSVSDHVQNHQKEWISCLFILMVSR